MRGTQKIRSHSLYLALLAAFPLTPALNAQAGEWSTSVSLDSRIFLREPRHAGQEDKANHSLTAQPEYYAEWNDGDDSLTFAPFLRIDNHDHRRTHADIRQLVWQHVERDWELRVGVHKVFWGVTESAHLVDIINQTDLVENTDGEDKLGQPMVNFSWISDWGVTDLFVLTGMRERSFPGRRGRLRAQPWVDVGQARFQADQGKGHIDLAARWSHYLGAWDLGLSHFYGSSREPRFEPGLDANGQSVLIPNYDLIHQTGADIQATLDGWLWKLEWISRKQRGERYTAAAAGFEYTLVGLFGSAADLGMISEYLFDDRSEDASTLFQNDLMLGVRLTLNDVQSSELLVGAIFDLEDDTRFFNLEASRRLGDRWKLTAELRLTSQLDGRHRFGSIRDDDYAGIEMSYYF